MNWFMQAMRNYAAFEGRAQRSEFWFFMLFFIILFVVAAVFDRLIVPLTGDLSIFTLILLVALLVPSLSVSIRRLHDTGRSGWWYLLSLFPVIGSIVLLVFFAQDSKSGTNQYGPNPKGM